MMYPLHMVLEQGVGFAVANCDAEFEALCAAGYVAPDAGPSLIVPSPPSHAMDTATDPAPRKRGRPKKVAE